MRRSDRLLKVSLAALCCVVGAVSVVSVVSATPPGPVHGRRAPSDDLAVHIDSMSERLDTGAIQTVREWLNRISNDHPAAQVTVSEAVQLAILHARVGADATASIYFRAAVQGAGNTADLAASELADLAAATYAIGLPQRADELLQACKARFANLLLSCRRWRMAEVAAAKDDWSEASRLLDLELRQKGLEPVDVERTAPLAMLRLRLSAAEKLGDALAAGQWRAILIGRGVRPPHPPAAAPSDVDVRASVAVSGLTWIVMGLTVVLLGALLLARRSLREDVVETP